MRDCFGMRFLGHREASEILARLQQRRQHKARIATGVCANEGEIFGQIVAGSQFLAGQPRSRRG